MEEVRQTIWQRLASCATARPEDRRNNWIATATLLLWALTYLLANWLIRSDSVAEGIPSYLVALVPIVFSILAVAAYMRFVRNADELLRKITLEAFAIGFGGGFVVTFALDLAEKLGFGQFDITTPWVAMSVCWVIGIVVATRRYS